MNKFLLTTTAVVALGSAANAGDLDINLGGFVDFQAGIVDEDTEARNGDQTVAFQNDSEIHVSVDGKADSGLEYGAVVELNADVTADGDGDGINADKTYLYMQGGWGRVELGNNTDAGDALDINSSNFAAGTGGTDGDWYDFVNLQGTIRRADLPLASGRDESEDATKITYYTPRFGGDNGGFQAGLSYIPDVTDAGTAAGFNLGAGAGNPTVTEDAFSFGVNYTGQMDNIGLGIAATYQGGSDATGVAGWEDLAAWNIGANISFSGVTIGGSFGNYELANITDGEYIDAGIGYETGPFGLSATYFKGEQKNAGGDEELENLAFSADYKLAPGLTPYIEYAIVEETIGTASTVDTGVLLIGAQLNF